MAILNFERNDFNKYVLEDKGLVLVDFWAPWCSYCRRIAPAYDKVAQQHEGELVFAKVDIDQVPQLADEWQIEVIPTFVLYKDGEAIDSIVAPESKAKLEEFILPHIG